MIRSNEQHGKNRQSIERLSIGKIVGAHGLRGEVRLRIWSHFPERIPKLAYVYIEDEPVPRKLRRARIQGEIALLALEGIETREAAEELQGRVVRIDLAQAAPLGEDEYYHFQLIGLRVRDEQGTLLGELVEILETGANDVYVVQTAHGELLLPALQSVILSIDLDAGEMIVRPPLYYDEEDDEGG